MKSPKVKVARVQNDTARLITDEEESKKRVESIKARRGSYTRLTDILAEDSFHVRNYPIPKGKELFPAEWKMQFVELFYPYAKQGPLYIDMPVTEYDIALCNRKRSALLKMGVRYIFIRPNQDENDVREAMEMA